MITFTVRLQEALTFATHHHGDQKHGARPYKYHLIEVLSVLIEFGVMDEDLLIAALLHDLVEDTKVTLIDLDAKFGTDVSDIVWRVTGVGKNREARNEVAYAKIKRSEKALILKLADRIANVRAGGPAYVGMYRKEHPRFCEALGNRHMGHNITAVMWLELDSMLSTDA